MAQENQERKLQGKIEINGTLECLTGLHIGSSRDNIEIGAVDSPVVRDPIFNAPYIPGSSLKGKLRALLEKVNANLHPDRPGGSDVYRHECDDWEKKNERQPGALNCPVCRLFGSTGPGESNRNYPARVKVRDLHLTPETVEQFAEIETDLYLTELKFENSIDRVTSAANPRNIERVPKGAKFEFSIIYDVEDPDTIKDDLENLKLSVEILHVDSLGGHGSRGYGWVKLAFNQTTVKKIDWYRSRADKDKQEAKPLNEMKNDDFQKLTSFFDKDASKAVEAA